jgi:FixJ family two-component response regulator
MIDEGTVYIVDDDDAVARSLKRVIESAGGCVQVFSTAEEFLDGYQGEDGCLLLDVLMPGMGGLELQDRLLEADIDLSIVFMSGHGDVAMASKTLRKGAVDFLPKPFRDDALLERIEEALARNHELRRERATRAEREERLSRLTDREQEILSHLVRGKTVKEVAFGLGLSPKTVQVHRANILEKTKTRSLVELTRLALVEDPDVDVA